MIDIDLKIVMLGARRCGKSSTLASMLASMDNIDSDIEVTYNDDITKKSLKEKQQKMRDIFNQENIIRGDWIDNEGGGDRTFTPYKLSIILHKALQVKVECIDFAGEMIHNDMLAITETTAKCDVIVIAVDTPQLMENNYEGKLANYIDAMTQFCQYIVQNHHASNQRIIFVPLKCEKYAHEGILGDVSIKIKETYRDMIECFKQVGSECYIVPVQTVGNLEFDKFDRSNRFANAIAHYKYCGEKKYEPQNCEQPLVYALESALKHKFPNY